MFSDVKCHCKWLESNICGLKLQDPNGDESSSDGPFVKSSRNAGLVRIWVAMQTTLCGRSAVSEDMIAKSSRNIRLSK